MDSFLLTMESQFRILLSLCIIEITKVNKSFWRQNPLSAMVYYFGTILTTRDQSAKLIILFDYDLPKNLDFYRIHTSIPVMTHLHSIFLGIYMNVMFIRMVNDQSNKQLRFK